MCKAGLLEGQHMALGSQAFPSRQRGTLAQIRCQPGALHNSAPPQGPSFPLYLQEHPGNLCPGDWNLWPFLFHGHMNL